MVQTAKLLNHLGQYNNESGGPDTNIFKLLVLKHDRAYLSMDLEESIMCVIMECTIQLPGTAYYTKYVSISVILLTTLILRTSTFSGNVRANIAMNLF